jgi:hypothetical protein
LVWENLYADGTVTRSRHRCSSHRHLLPRPPQWHDACPDTSTVKPTFPSAHPTKEPETDRPGPPTTLPRGSHLVSEHPRSPTMKPTRSPSRSPTKEPTNMGPPPTNAPTRIRLVSDEGTHSIQRWKPTRSPSAHPEPPQTDQPTDKRHEGSQRSRQGTTGLRRQKPA